jgi:receptor protein-tyrosine kinase
MTTTTMADAESIPDSEIGQVLIDRCQLSTESVQKIVELVRAENLNFVDAALRLGLVKDDDVEAAIASRRRRAGDANGKPGLIEFAISKIAGRRESAVTVDAEPVVPDTRLIPTRDADDSRSERLRTLCTELLLDARSGPTQSRVIALVSPSPGEGRSQLAAEIAIGFSQLGRETLLIDADLRRPQQHKLFNADNESGLSQVLLGKQTLKVKKVKGLPSLQLLTSGTPPDNSLELLSDGRLARLIKLLRGMYQFIVIDTPPINQFADGLAIATTATEALVVSRAHRTTHESVREMLRRFAPTRARTVGAIVNYF